MIVPPPIFGMSFGRFTRMQYCFNSVWGESHGKTCVKMCFLPASNFLENRPYRFDNDSASIEGSRWTRFLCSGW